MTELDPEIAAMLRREGACDDIPADAAARLAARLSASIGGGGSGSGSGSGSGGGSGSGSGSGGGSGSGSGSAGAGAGVGFVKFAPFLLTFVVGAGVGAVAVSSGKREHAPQVVHVETAPRASAAPSAAPPPSAAPASSIATMSVDALPSALAVPGPSSSAVRAREDGGAEAAEDTFVAERKLLDAARTALARGAHAEARRALDHHARTYPSGRLNEEREALLVRALADSGDLEEARATAARFRARWPGSVLLPAVEAAVGGR